MHGTVLSFNMGANEGVIDGTESGARYKFFHSDWKSEGEPEPGLKVEFDCAADRAWDIYVIP